MNDLAPLSLLMVLCCLFFSMTVIAMIKFIDERNKNLYLQGDLKPYFRKKYYLSPSEQKLFHILFEFAKQHGYLLVPQVHLSSIFEVKEDAKDLRGKFEWLNSLSVDFMLFNKQTFQPVAAIELNDRTHLWLSRKARDQFVQRAFNENNIKLLTVQTTHLVDGTINSKLEAIL